MCFLLGLSACAFEVAQRVIAGQPLPDASLVAYAGSRKPKPPAQPKISDVTLTGIISDVQPNGLPIDASKTGKSKNQTQWFVILQADTEGTIFGTATFDYLRKGQTIEFSGRIVSNEKVEDKVKEMTIGSVPLIVKS
jgi:hypothetical protein